MIKLVVPSRAFAISTLVEFFDAKWPGAIKGYTPPFGTRGIVVSPVKRIVNGAVITDGQRVCFPGYYTCMVWTLYLREIEPPPEEEIETETEVTA